MRSHFSFLMPWLAAGLLVALGRGGTALGATPVGSEFQVNTYTTGGQGRPSVAVDADGHFVVVWTSGGSAGSDSDETSIQGQRYDASGGGVGSEFQVNTYTTLRQVDPSLAVAADGDFAVVWESLGSAESDTDGRSIHAQRYDASGGAVGTEFQVNSYTTSDQRGSSVAVDADGDFVVVWFSYGSAGSDTSYWSIQGQRYDASGNALGSEFQVNSYTTLHQIYPSVAVDADGDFVVVWTSNGSAGSDSDESSIQGQRYDASGNPLGAEFQVNSYTTDYQWSPSAAVDADGDFVVVWDSLGSAGSDTSSKSIQGQRYDASGNPVGSQFQVNTYTTNGQYRPAVAVDPDGGFAVVWYGNGSAGSDTAHFAIQGQSYDARGGAVGSEFQVNSYTTSDQRRPAVAVDAHGDFVVMWDSIGSAGSDTDLSVQGQRYSAHMVIPALWPPALIGLAALLLGAGALRLRRRLRFPS